jgi:anaerobic selenocysteine-containing dehydrogenase
MKTNHTLAIACLLSTALLAAVTYVSTQPALARQSSARAWRYAYVQARNDSTAEICYAEARGCRIDVVSVPGVPMRGEVGLTDGGATTHRAMVKAMATLGAAGWEMVGQSTVLNSDGRSSVLVFKRGE